MKLKDLEVGQKVWFAMSRDDLRRGEGEQVKVRAIGRYTAVHEPCGYLIVPTDSPGPTRVVLEFKDDDRNLAKFSKTGKQRYRLNDGGRYLMHESEHALMRAARADRELETEAHQQRGKALYERVSNLVHKALREAGLPDELIKMHLMKRYYRSGSSKYISKGFFEPTFDLDDNKVFALITSPELRRAIDEYAEHSAKPVPGKECRR